MQLYRQNAQPGYIITIAKRFDNLKHHITDIKSCCSLTLKFGQMIVPLQEATETGGSAANTRADTARIKMSLLRSTLQKLGDEPHYVVAETITLKAPYTFTEPTRL